MQPLAATFYCVPLAAQTGSLDNANAQKISLDGTPTVQLKDGRKMSLAQIVGLSNEEKDDVLDNQLTEEQYKIFSEWRKLLLAQANQRIAEKDRDIAATNARIVEKDFNIAATNARIAEKEKDIAIKDIALKLYEEFKTVFRELSKELDAPKPLTPVQRVINKQRAATILAVLDNPLLVVEKKADLSTVLMPIAKRLEAGENFNAVEKKVIKLSADVL